LRNHKHSSCPSHRLILQHERQFTVFLLGI
jgi:hypothetical protein